MRTADPANWLFSKDKPNVIAYGERIFTEATAGDGMIEFEIPIEYYKTDIKPSNIIVVCLRKADMATTTQEASHRLCGSTTCNLFY